MIQTGVAKGTFSGVERGPVYRVRRRLGIFARRYPLGFAGGVLLALMGTAAILAPLIAPHDPLIQDIPNRLTAPSSQYWLGTDNFGRDVLSRALYGTRISLYVGFASVSLATVVGMLIGIASGYLGGVVDLVLQRAVDMLLGFPGLILAMVMVVAMGASLNNVVLAIAVVFSPRVVRLARSSALSIKEEPYVLAAQSIGASHIRIMLRHILPKRARSGIRAGNGVPWYRDRDRGQPQLPGPWRSAPQPILGKHDFRWVTGPPRSSSLAIRISRAGLGTSRVQFLVPGRRPSRRVRSPVARNVGGLGGIERPQPRNNRGSEAV